MASSDHDQAGIGPVRGLTTDREIRDETPRVGPTVPVAATDAAELAAIAGTDHDPIEADDRRLPAPRRSNGLRSVALYVAVTTFLLIAVPYLIYLVAEAFGVGPGSHAIEPRQFLPHRVGKAGVRGFDRHAPQRLEDAEQCSSQVRQTQPSGGSGRR